jgi:hypothetical protein
MSVERGAPPVSSARAVDLCRGLDGLVGGGLIIALQPQVALELEGALAMLGRCEQVRVVVEGSAIHHVDEITTELTVVSEVHSPDEVDRAVSILGEQMVVVEARALAGLLVLRFGAAQSETDIPDIDSGALLSTISRQLQRLWEADRRVAIGELEAVHAANERERNAELIERERLREAHRRDIQKIKRSSRYQIGDILLQAARNPKTIAKAFRRLRQLARQARAQAEPVHLLLPAVPPRRALKVGAVLDEFSWSCFAHEAELVELTPSELTRHLDRGIDLVLVESAWQGNRGAWRYKINKFEPGLGSPLEDLARQCRERGIPAVFWNKEDPVNFEVFLPAARQFPIVLTTAQEAVDHYRAELGHDGVGVLPFAAQPAIHNPIGRDSSPVARACFAGAWRGDKYASRSDDFRLLLDPLLGANLIDIYDRYANHRDRETLGFPEPYRRAVRGSLPYDEMVQAYRRYPVFLNVNSVVDSPTMFSRRVFELLACGTPVVSTASRGITELLGDHVMIPSRPSETLDMVELMISDAVERDRRGHLGYRHIHREHTYDRRMAEILRLAGVADPVERSPLVTVIAVSNRPQQLEHVLGSFTRQSYLERELIFVANSDQFDHGALEQRLAEIDGARLVVMPEAATLAECLNEGMDIARGDFVAKYDDDDDYGAEYLWDMMLTFGYSGAAVAGKRSYHAYVHEGDRTVLRFPGREFSYVKSVVGGTLVFDRRKTGDIRFTPVERGTDTIFLEDCVAAGLKIFSADRYNFIQHRHVDVTRHTWQISTDQFLEATVQVAAGYASERVFL